MALITAIGIFGNIHIGNIQLIAFDNPISIIDIGVSQTQGFDLGSGQFEAGRELFVNLIIKIGAAVLSNQTAGNKIPAFDIFTVLRFLRPRF